MSGKIKTTGQLREFLADMMVGVKNGQLDIDKASRITKLAGQVNESLYAEIKMARTNIDLGRDQAELGELNIGSKS